jgi:hypothetical protein
MKEKPMNAKFKLGPVFACIALAGAFAAQAATDTPAKPAAAKPAAAKPAAAKPAAAKPVAAKKAPAGSSLSPAQISTAERVLTGKVACEFDQAFDIAPVNGKAGHFNVGFKGKTYTMVPEATTTGAIRLEDKKNGMMWLQIANKSMLMNTKAGQRMVDNCKHPAQA